MSFKLLKKVIMEFRRKERCPNCASFFSEDFIFVLASSTKITARSDALLFIVCDKCFHSSFVIVEVKNLRDRIQHEFIRFDTKIRRNGVSIDEVLDMRNFLKSYQGELSELLKEKT